jgi:hypothetical protein
MFWWVILCNLGSIMMRPKYPDAYSHLVVVSANGKCVYQMGLHWRSCIRLHCSLLWHFRWFLLQTRRRRVQIAEIFVYLLPSRLVSWGCLTNTVGHSVFICDIAAVVWYGCMPSENIWDCRQPRLFKIRKKQQQLWTAPNCKQTKVTDKPKVFESL